MLAEARIVVVVMKIITGRRPGTVTLMKGCATGLRRRGRRLSYRSRLMPFSPARKITVFRPAVHQIGDADQRDPRPRHVDHPGDVVREAEEAEDVVQDAGLRVEDVAPDDADDGDAEHVRREEHGAEEGRGAQLAGRGGAR